MARKIKPGCPQQLMVIILKVIIVKYCAFPPPPSLQFTSFPEQVLLGEVKTVSVRKDHGL